MNKKYIEEEKKMQSIINNFLKNASDAEKELLNLDLIKNKISVEQAVVNINSGKYICNDYPISKCVSIIENFIISSDSQCFDKLESDLSNGVSIKQIAYNIIEGNYIESNQRRKHM